MDTAPTTASRTNIAGTILAGATLTGAVLWLGLGPPAATASEQQLSPASAVERCEEDEPCWDWQTHGNRSAGAAVTLPDGEVVDVVVTAHADGTYTARTP